MRFAVFIVPVLPFLLGGCVAGCSGEASRVEDVEEDLRKPRLVVPSTPDRHPFADVTKLRDGQWATYREGTRTFTLAVAGREGDATWIEKIEEGEPRQISATRVSPEGEVKQALYGEINAAGSPSTVEPQPLSQAGTGPPKMTETSRETGEEKVTVAGRELKATRVTIRSEDLEGRFVEQVSLWHPDIPPIYAGSDAGGLIRRTSRSATVVLVAFGNDHKPLLKRPAKN